LRWYGGRLALDEPLGDQLAPELLDRWKALHHLPGATPRQLLAHTSGVPNYFRAASFAARLKQDPARRCQPAELVDQVAAHASWRFPPGRGFESPTPAT
jgi:CubicO group peptidase (beta-lactamase class C family)